MKIMRATLKCEPGEAENVVSAIRDIAQKKGIQGVVINHIAGDILTLHAPEDYFEELKRTKGLVQSEDARPVFPLQNTPKM